MSEQGISYMSAGSETCIDSSLVTDAGTTRPDGATIFDALAGVDGGGPPLDGLRRLLGR